MEDINRGHEQVLEKLSIGSESVTEDSKDLFLKACSRLIGKESLLHTGYRTLADKFSRSKEAKTSHITKVDATLIMLSPAQREVFRTVKTNEQLKYYCFVGGSGTGKTYLSLRTVDNLIQRYEARDPGQNIQVYLTYRENKSEENLALRDTFQAFGKGKGDNVKLHISKFEDLGEFYCILFSIILLYLVIAEDEKLANLCQRLKEKHAREPVILFIDENDITSAGNFSPQFSLKNMDDFFIVSAISPISDNYVRLKSSGFDFNEMEISIREVKEIKKPTALPRK